MNLTLRHPSQQQPIEVELHPVDAAQGIFRYRIGPQQGEFRVTFTRTGGVLERNGRVVPFHAARIGETIHLWLRGKRHGFEVVDRTARRAGSAATVTTRDELTAPMPGTILKLKTTAGSTFKPHDPLIIMESMKMEMTLSVPHEGKVAAVLCREGQLVDMGAVLLKLAPPENEAEPTSIDSSAKSEA